MFRTDGEGLIDEACGVCAVVSHHGVEQIREYITADSLAYLSIQGLREAASSARDATQFCEACFSGDYPIPLNASKPEP